VDITEDVLKALNLWARRGGVRRLVALARGLGV